MKILSKIYTFLVFFFLYIPIFVLIIFSFNESKSTSVFTGFSFDWYLALLEQEDILNALKTTLILAVGSSIISTVFGTAAAVGIDSLRKGWLRSATMGVTNIPMMNPEIVTGFSMMLLFVFASKLLGISDSMGFGTLMIAHITFELPYVILNVLPKLRQTDRNLAEAAQDLGCRPVQAFFKVVLPSIKPGIITGMIMAFTLSLDDFIISYFTNGREFQTLPTIIYSMTKKRVTPVIYSLSTLIFFSILLLLILTNLIQYLNEKKQNKPSD